MGGRGGGKKGSEGKMEGHCDKREEEEEKEGKGKRRWKENERGNGKKMEEDKRRK